MVVNSCQQRDKNERRGSLSVSKCQMLDLTASPQRFIRLRIKHHRKIQDQKLEIIIRQTRKHVIKTGKHLDKRSNEHKIEQLGEILSGEAAQDHTHDKQSHDHQEPSADMLVDHEVRFFIVEAADENNDPVAEKEYQTRAGRIGDQLLDAQAALCQPVGR